MTLLELLVVVAIIGILASLLLPAVLRAKGKAQGVACVGNVRQLGLAWQMYSDDHKGFLPPNLDGSKATNQWISGIMTYGPNNHDATNASLLVDPSYAVLGPYLRDAALFKCPSDKSLAQFTHGPPLPRVRSYALSQVVGWNVEQPVYLNQVVDADWRVFRRQSDFHAMSPTKVLTFLDEHPDSISDGAFGVAMIEESHLDSAWMVDVPASYHAGAASIAFADGHVEVRRWLDPRTRPPARYQPGAAQHLGRGPQPGNLDLLWLSQHFTTRAKVSPP